MNGKPRKITASEDLIMCLQEYKKLIKKNNLLINEMDLFYAGYVIANPIVKENLLKERKQEIKREKELCR